MPRSAISSIPMRHLSAALAFLLLLTGGVTAQTTVTLDREQMHVVARQALLSGDPVLAREIAAALLEADPEDRVALLILAAAEPRLGRPGQGRMAGARAFRLAQTDVQRYEAARLTALAARQGDRHLLSMLWLRRAAIVAPSGRDLAQTRADFGRVRSESPVSLRLRLGLSPSSNVNNGADDPFNEIDGLPFVGVLSEDAVAQPGVTASADLSLGYRLQASPDSVTRATARLYQTAVWLTDPDTDLSGRDFAQTYLEFGLTHGRQMPRGVMDARLSIARDWSGGEPESDRLSATLGYGWQAGSDTRLRVVVGAEQAWPVSGGSDRFEWSTGLSTRSKLENGGVLSWGLAYSKTHSDNGNARQTETTLSLGYSLPEKLGPARLELLGRVTYEDFPDYAVIFAVPGGRQDTSLTGAVSATFVDYSFAGFAPTATLGLTSTTSNVSRFETEALSLRLGFVSNF